MVRKKVLFLKVLIGLAVFMLIAGCNPAAAKKLLVGTLSSVSAEASTETGFSSLADEQLDGYDLGLKKEVTRYHLTQANEGNLSDDVQSVVREMIEENEVAALLGATTNEATRRAASLANFFNVPMIIPAADGDTLLPSNNMWVFQLNAPSSAYAEYVFGNVLSKINVSAASTEDESALIIRLAIVYEENTFGESAAVATAHTAMDQNIEIVYYGSYTPDVGDAREIKTLAENVVSNEADLIYIVSSNPADAALITSALDTEFGAGLTPAILGQGNGFTSLEFQEAVNSDHLYVIRQALDAETCPEKIDSIQKAQVYAAAYLLEAAILETDTSMPRQKLFSTEDQLTIRREKIRDALKELNIEVPCLGQVSFDNNGQIKENNFEIFRVQAGETHLIDAPGFRSLVLEIAGRDELIITD